MADPVKLTPTGSAEISPGSQAQRSRPTNRLTSEGTDFAQALEQAQNLRFSNHAQKRLQAREITLTDDGLSRLATAIEKAQKRGGRESLVVMDDLAFIVNIRDRLVVTAVDASSRGEGVFTQIDSVVFADKSDTTSNEQA